MDTRYSGLLFTLVGPAGVGKNTVMQEAIRSVPELRQLPTATTRAIRPSETEGREHYFVSVDEFITMRDDGKLLEHQEVHGNWYGIAREPLEAALNAGELLLADIDMYGARAARALFPRNSILVFIMPPSMATLVNRMRDRRESEAQIARRLLRAPEEMAFAPECDYIVINDTLASAVKSLLNIIAWERQQLGDWRKAETASVMGYSARMIVVHGDRAAVAETGRFPEQRFESGVLPHLAAFAALEPLGILPPMTALTTLPEADGFVPPQAIEIESAGGEDTCIYTYVVRLAAAAPLASGWSWVPTNQLPLASALRTVLDMGVFA